MTPMRRRRLAKLEAAKGGIEPGPRAIVICGVHRDEAGERTSRPAFALIVGQKSSIRREPAEDEAAFLARVERASQKARLQ
jgi:hypothetical protein